MKKLYLILQLHLLRNGEVIAKRGGTSTCKSAEDIANVSYALIGYILSGILGDVFADKVACAKDIPSTRIRVRVELHFDGAVLKSCVTTRVHHNVSSSTYSAAGMVISDVLSKALLRVHSVKEAS